MALSERLHTVLQPALCIVAQGARRELVGQDVYEYDLSRPIVFSVDPPVTYQVSRTPACTGLQRPYREDIARLRESLAEVVEGSREIESN